MQSSLLHVVALSMVGGKQESAINLITNEKMLSQFKQFVINSASNNTDKNYSKLLHENNVNLLEINFIKGKLFRKLFLLLRILLIRPSAVVLWSTIPNNFFCFLLKSLKIKIIFWDHGVSRKKKVTQKQINNLKQVSLIIANSDATKRYLELEWKQKSIAVCKNFIKPFPASNLSNKMSINKDKSKLIIGFAGRLVALKGIALLVKSISLLINEGFDVELHIAGRKSSEYSYLRKQVTKLGIDNYVTFLGLVNDMSEFYQSVDLLVSPSLSESFGNVNIEAAYFGCPAIVSNIDGLSETVINNLTGLILDPDMPLSEYCRKYTSDCKKVPPIAFFPKDNSIKETKALRPKIIFESIKVLYLDRDRLNSMSNQASTIIPNKFSINNHVSCVIASIKPVLKD